jgi:hypothetical protein
MSWSLSDRMIFAVLIVASGWICVVVPTCQPQSTCWLDRASCHVYRVQDALYACDDSVLLSRNIEKEEERIPYFRTSKRNRKC